MAELCSVSLSIWRGQLQNIIGDAAGTEEAAAKKKAEEEAEAKKKAEEEAAAKKKAEAAKKEATTKGKAKMPPIAAPLTKSARPANHRRRRPAPAAPRPCVNCTSCRNC